MNTDKCQLSYLCLSVFICGYQRTKSAGESSPPSKVSPARHAPALGLRAGMLTFHSIADQIVKELGHVVHIGIRLLEIAVPAYGLFKAGIAAPRTT